MIVEYLLLATRFKQQNIINEFVLYILTSNEYREYIRSVCVGGIDKRQINKEHLEEFPIIFPPTELQIQFADFIKSCKTDDGRLSTIFKKLAFCFSPLPGIATHMHEGVMSNYINWEEIITKI